MSQAEEMNSAMMESTYEEADYYYFIKYKAESWDHERLGAVHSHKYESQLFKIYRKRGVMENSIKELKLVFFYDKSDSTGFIENAGRSMLASVV